MILNTIAITGRRKDIEGRLMQFRFEKSFKYTQQRYYKTFKKVKNFTISTTTDNDLLA